MNRPTVDPFPPPVWLVPHRHPAIFRRQALGVRFRWPGPVGWAVVVASMVVGVLVDWPWLPVLPALAVILWTGVLTNAGKPLAGAIVAMGGLIVFNLVGMAALVAGMWAVVSLGL